MIKIIDKEYLSSDKKHMLKGKVYIPEGEPKGGLTLSCVRCARMDI